MADSKAELVGKVTDLARRKDAVGEYTRLLITDETGERPDLSKLTGPTLRVVIDAADLFDTFTDAVTEVEASGARLALETVEYPNGRVGVDGYGNLVSAQFDVPTLVTFEVAE